MLTADDAAEDRKLSASAEGVGAEGGLCNGALMAGPGNVFLRRACKRYPRPTPLTAAATEEELGDGEEWEEVELDANGGRLWAPLTHRAPDREHGAAGAIGY